MSLWDRYIYWMKRHCKTKLCKCLTKPKTSNIDCLVIIYSSPVYVNTFMKLDPEWFLRSIPIFGDFKFQYIGQYFFQAHETSICLLCVLIYKYLLKYYDNTVYNLVYCHRLWITHLCSVWVCADQLVVVFVGLKHMLPVGKLQTMQLKHSWISWSVFLLSLLSFLKNI